MNICPDIFISTLLVQKHFQDMLNEPGALMNIGPDIFISTLLVQEHLGTYLGIGSMNQEHLGTYAQIYS